MTANDVLEMIEARSVAIRNANKTSRGKTTERAEETCWFFDSLANDVRARMAAEKE